MKRTKATAQPDSVHPKQVTKPIRDRVLQAALAAFRERGFARTSMLEIATRAQVSKRDLYALFRNKHAVLAECISQRAQSMRRPLNPDAPVPATREALTAMLIEIGSSIMQGVCHPEVLAMFRLAISESDRAPDIARALDRAGREANHRALTELLGKVQPLGLIMPGDPADLAARYFVLLWGGLLVQLLMRVRNPPNKDAIRARARVAAEALLA